MKKHCHPLLAEQHNQAATVEWLDSLCRNLERAIDSGCLPGDLWRETKALHCEIGRRIEELNGSN